LARLDESIAAFNQRFIFPLPFAMKIIKINLWNQGKMAEHWASISKVVGSIPTVARHTFKACPVWIYTQSNITSIIFT
jgi:hypothetical protein